MDAFKYRRGPNRLQLHRPEEENDYSAAILFP
jgi:hypothetical protein